LNGYIPQGLDVATATELRQRDPSEYCRRALDSIAAHVRGMLDLQKLGAVTFDYGNNIRTFAFEQGVKDAYDFPALCPPTFVLSSAKDAAVPLGGAFGEPSDIYRTDQIVLEMFPQNEMLTRWIRLAQKRVRFQGCPRESAGSATASAREIRPRAERPRRARRNKSAHRDWPRPSRLRLGRFALSRDRSDARRLGCRGRLAIPECHASTQPVAPPGFRSITVRCGHRLLATRRAK